MRRKTTGVAFLLAVLLTATVAFACGDDDEPSTEDAEAQLCADLSALDTAIEDLEGITADSTVDELREANEAVADAEGRVVESAQAVGEARIGDLDAAFEDLDSAVTDIPGDATIADALSSIGQGLDGVRAAWQQLFASAGCD